MRIAVDIRLLGRGGMTGVEEYARNIVDGLIKSSGGEFNLFYNGLRMNPPPPEWVGNPRVKITNYHIPNKILDLSFAALKYPDMGKLLKADVVFSPHFNILETGNTPKVMTVHDCSFLHHPDFFSWKKGLWHSMQMFGREAKKAKKLIAVSEFTKNDLAELLKIRPEKISVVYSGVNPSFKKLPEDNAELMAFKKNHNLDFPFILYLGTIEPRKNIIGIVRAFNLLRSSGEFKDLRLIIAGSLGWLYQNIISEAESSPHARDIIFWGAVKPNERIFLYNICKAFVYPSFFEGFGFPPLEAQACGAPVVASDRTSIPEILGNSALLVDPWKVSRLADAVSSLLTGGSTGDRLVKAGYENIKRFSWEKTTEQTLKIIHESAGA